MTKKKEANDERRYVIVFNGRNPVPIKGNRAQRRAQVVVGGPPPENPFVLTRDEVAAALKNFQTQGYQVGNGQSHIFEVTRAVGHKIELDFGDDK